MENPSWKGFWSENRPKIYQGLPKTCARNLILGAESLSWRQSHLLVSSAYLASSCLADWCRPMRRRLEGIYVCDWSGLQRLQRCHWWIIPLFPKFLNMWFYAYLASSARILKLRTDEGINESWNIFSHITPLSFNWAWQPTNFWSTRSKNTVFRPNYSLS